MNTYLIYLGGMVISIWLFYSGAKRGGSTNPGLAAFLFGAVWPFTISIFFFQLIKSYVRTNDKIK